MKQNLTAAWKNEAVALAVEISQMAATRDEYKVKGDTRRADGWDREIRKATERKLALEVLLAK